jgi:hypothetical protein
VKTRPVSAVAWILLSTGSIVATSAARAGTITDFTDRPTFNAAVGLPLTIETFTDDDHFPISTGVLNSATSLVVSNGTPINPGDIQPGVTYSTPIGTGFFFNIDSGGNFIGGFLDGLVSNNSRLTLTTAFDNPVVGFGFDTNSLMGTQFDLTIHFTAGPDFNQTLPVSGAGFFGFVSSATDIQSAQITGNDGTFSFALDNFTFPTPNSIGAPEPSSLVLLALGGVGVGVAGYSRRRHRPRSSI